MRRNHWVCTGGHARSAVAVASLESITFKSDNMFIMPEKRGRRKVGRVQEMEEGRKGKRWRKKGKEWRKGGKERREEEKKEGERMRDE